MPIFKRLLLKNKPSLSRYTYTRLIRLRATLRISCRNSKFNGKINWISRHVPLKYTKPWPTFTFKQSKILRSQDHQSRMKADRVPPKEHFQLKGNAKTPCLHLEGKAKTPYPQKPNQKPVLKLCLSKIKRKRLRSNLATDKQESKQLTRRKQAKNRVV